jgi:hypothetical protein
MSIDSSYSVDNVKGSPSVFNQDHHVEDDMVNVVNFGDEFDEEVDPHSELNSGDEAEAWINLGDIGYNEEEIEGFGFLTLEEQQQQLEGELGAELEQELYDARESVQK